MTIHLFLDDSQAGTMQANVLAVTEAGIVLDRSVFYARSGGQPGDTGVLRWPGGETAIADTIKVPREEGGATILHIPAPGSALPPEGAEVTGELDWKRRHALMRMHTAMHLLCAALPGIAVTGGQVGADKSRLDFDMAEPPSREALQDKLNALVRRDDPVSAEWVEESLLDSNPELVRTLSVKPPRGTGRLRLVRIGDAEAPIDLQPCGGTHVSHTGEIGALVIAKIENKGRQNRRIVLQFTDQGENA
jgi:misacylated tRNA(Ala) deacylase